MKHVSNGERRRQILADKAAGIKHSPLFSLKECCEAAGVAPHWYGMMARKYPNAPAPILRCGPRSRPLYNKQEVVEWATRIKQNTK